tara:strand:+ start:168 stop:365 length:198 start_codon:yes stop_codon:yes gene_type:complete
MKFNIQDRIILDEMTARFKEQLSENYKAYKKKEKVPIITESYWLHMLEELQVKIDHNTTKKALKL